MVDGNAKPSLLLGKTDTITEVKLTLLQSKTGTIALCLTTFNRLFLLLSSLFSYFVHSLKKAKGFLSAEAGNAECALSRRKMKSVKNKRTRKTSQNR
jgi:hypothetical protein